MTDAGNNTSAGAANRPWTAGERESLRALYAAGASWARIAKRLGRKPDAVYRAARRFGIETGKQRWTAGERESLRAMYSAGVGRADIAKCLNRTPDAVHKAARRFGIETGNCPWTAGERDLLRAMYSAGVSPAAIAKRLGRTVNAVHKAAGRFGCDTGRRPIVRRPVIAYRTKGLTDTEIARRLGRHSGTIRKWRLRQDLPATADAQRKAFARFRETHEGLAPNEWRLERERVAAAMDGWRADQFARGHLPIGLLLESQGPMTVAALAAARGKSPNWIRRVLAAMIANGSVVQSGWGELPPGVWGPRPKLWDLAPDVRQSRERARCYRSVI